MFKKLMKSLMAFMLAMSLAILPVTPIFAKEVTDQQANNLISNGTSSASENTDEFKEVAEVAKQKADLITNLFGATSVQYALISDGKIVVSGQSGVYSKESGKVPTDTNMYGIGSVSKMFTAAAVMFLVDEGKVNLDTAVTQYIPDFTMADPRYKDITARMLLNHSSGLMGTTYRNSNLMNDTDTSTYDNLLNYLKYSRLKADPGEFSVYCNDGFTLAQILVERVSGISFTEFIKKNFSEPLGLEYTKSPSDKFNKENLSKTYIDNFTMALPAESYNNVIGAGGIYSTAKDLCTFSKIFMKKCNTGILSDSSIKAMENKEYLKGIWPEDGDTIINYGLGWDSVNLYPFNQYGIKALSKGGDTLLYHANLTILPDENMAIAITASGASSDILQIMSSSVLLTALKDKGSIPSIKPGKVITAPIPCKLDTDMSKYEGIYAFYGGLQKIEINEDGTLMISNPSISDSPSLKLIYTGNGKFYSEDGSMYVTFVEKKNNIYLYTSQYFNVGGLGELTLSQFQLQKLDNNPISKEIEAVWKEREGKIFFLINEKYSSEVYLEGIPNQQISLAQGIDGYCFYNAIIDENTAKSNLKIPGISGRDLSDIKFYKIGNTQYLKSGETLLISEDAIKSLSSKSSFTCQINSSGLAKWYKIGKATANKKVKISVPKNAAFILYDKNGTCIHDSFITKNDTVILPENGYIVFAGDANVKFLVKSVK